MKELMETKEHIKRINEKWAQWRQLHDPESWEYKFVNQLDGNMSAARYDPTGYAFVLQANRQ